MIPLREFTSARELLEFYRHLRARMKALGPPPRPPGKPKRAPPTRRQIATAFAYMTPLGRIITAVAEDAGTSPESVRSGLRPKDTIIPRQMVALLARDLLHMSNADIGQAMGLRHQSTVSGWLHNGTVRLRHDPDFARKLTNLRSRLLEDGHASPNPGPAHVQAGDDVLEDHSPGGWVGGRHVSAS